MFNLTTCAARGLVAAIEVYLAERNLNPKLYRWQTTGEEILAKIRRPREQMAVQGG